MLLNLLEFSVSSFSHRPVPLVEVSCRPTESNLCNDKTRKRSQGYVDVFGVTECLLYFADKLS